MLQGGKTVVILARLLHTIPPFLLNITLLGMSLPRPPSFQPALHGVTPVRKQVRPIEARSGVDQTMVFFTSTLFHLPGEDAGTGSSHEGLEVGYIGIFRKAVKEEGVSWKESGDYA